MQWNHCISTPIFKISLHPLQNLKQSRRMFYCISFSIRENYNSLIISVNDVYILSIYYFMHNRESNVTVYHLQHHNSYVTEMKFYTGIVVEVTFEITSSDDPSDINFSLSCNSQYGEAGNRAVWTKDDVLLNSDGSLDLVNASISLYTNILVVRSGTSGTYVCQIRGMADQLLNSATFSVQGMVGQMQHQNFESQTHKKIDNRYHYSCN